MPAPPPTGLRALWKRSSSLAFPILIVVSVLVIVIPLPALMMDFLLACNVTIAVIILLTTIYVDKPLDFSVFPALLLGTTLARLVLNVASTRLILTRGGTEGAAAAGGVIESFGSFVAGNNIVVGLIIFVILIVIQFMVITQGATRISEVTARFTLDAMPAKQMAIDADMNAGLIDQEEARTRRQEIGAEADFYGAMDGASKFVRGDSMASIVITLINIVGGLYIGIVQNDMQLAEAGSVFTTLTIGDGLVTQIPGFLISLAAGLVVTRSSASQDLSGEVVGQLFNHSQAMFLAAGFLICLSFTGLPLVPLIALASSCGLIGWSLQKDDKDEAVAEAEATAAAEAEEAPASEPEPQDQLRVELLELELGGGLIGLVDPTMGGDLLPRINQTRLDVAQKLGILMPKVRIRDNVQLRPQQYRLKLRDVPIAWGEVHPDLHLAVELGPVRGKIPGLEAVDPTHGLPARWINPALTAQAEALGYGVFEPTLVVTTHLTETVQTHAAELLSRQQVHQLLDHLKQTAPQLVEDLIPGELKVSQVHQVLSHLLDEQVPVRDLEAILETLSDFADRTKDVITLTECVRNALARTICEMHRNTNRVLRAIHLDPAWEELISQHIVTTQDGGGVLQMPGDLKAKLLTEIATGYDQASRTGGSPVLLVSPVLRPRIRQITREKLPKLPVMSVSEITRDTSLELVGMITPEPVAGAA